MNTEPSPLADVPVNHEADAKDALREQGIVTGLSEDDLAPAGEALPFIY